MITYYKNTLINYSVEGEGPALVLLHGFLLSSTYWNTLIPGLLKKNKVVTIDLLGHGKSGCISEIHTMELMAEVINFVLKELNIQSANFIGHSMGGYVALAFAEKYESKIDKLVLLNSTPAPDSLSRKKNRESALVVINKNPSVFLTIAIKNLFAEKTQKEFETEIKKLNNEASLFPVEGITAAIKGMKNRKDRTSLLKNFRGEKYMICGTEDPILPFSELKQLAFKSETTFKKVKSGHMSLTENIEEIVKIMYFIDFI